jgi:glycosyltransferase involved in cell wall biosynthesis
MDTTSGAAISERTTCEMLAKAGWRVRVVATTASESYCAPDPRCLLESLGIDVHRERSSFRFSHRGVSYCLLDTGSARVSAARGASGLDTLLGTALNDEIPDILLTYGGSEAEIRRRTKARGAGACVVFSMHNCEYRSPGAFAGVDAILTPSRFVSDHYRRTHGVDSIPLPVPVNLADVIAPSTEPAFFTLINPTPRKGVRLFVRLIKECSERWPDLAFLAVESRASGEALTKMIEAPGVGVRNLHIVPNTPKAASIYALTRVLLMPSLVEAAGRVAVEAQLNGIPVIASDRDGLPETVGDGGLVLPASADPESPEGVAVVRRWVELVGRLHLDRDFYQRASRAAWEGVTKHRSGDVERERVAIFEAIAKDGRMGVIDPSPASSSVGFFERERPVQPAG